MALDRRARSPSPPARTPASPGTSTPSTALLARHGLTPDALGCVPDLPLGADAARAYLAAGRAARPARDELLGQARRDARRGRAARRATSTPATRCSRPAARAVADLAGPVLAASTDGCGAPAFATTLTDLARLPWALAHADPGTTAGRVAAAMRAHPWLVAGTGRLDTVLMAEVPGALAKVGAEGVLVAGLPDGCAFAAKVDDGHARALGPVLLDLLAAAGLRRAGRAGGRGRAARRRRRASGRGNAHPLARALTRRLGGVMSPNVS